MTNAWSLRSTLYDRWPKARNTADCIHGVIGRNIESIAEIMEDKKYYIYSGLGSRPSREKYYGKRRLQELMRWRVVEYYTPSLLAFSVLLCATLRHFLGDSERDTTILFLLRTAQFWSYMFDLFRFSKEANKRTYELKTEY